QSVANLTLQGAVDWLKPKALPEPEPAAAEAWSAEEDRAFEMFWALFFHRSVWHVRRCMMLASLSNKEREARTKLERMRMRLRNERYLRKWEGLMLAHSSNINEIRELLHQRSKFRMLAAKFDAARAVGERKQMEAIKTNGWRLPNGLQLP